MPERENGTRPAVIAVCGKGGVGKTSISAMITGALARDPARRILAIDADPAVGLALALGFSPARTVDDIRSALIEQVERGGAGDARSMVEQLDFEVAAALEERDGIAFLAIGRPEKDGCYCQVNDLLRDIIGSVARSFDAVVIDGEAGIEQVNRRVMERITHLVLVSDSSRKGLGVAAGIHAVAGRAADCAKAGLIVNRVRPGDDTGTIAAPGGIPFLGTVPEDDSVRRFDMEGRSILGIGESPAARAVRECMSRLGLDVLHKA